MTSNTIYPYTQRDLLNQPEYYMYSAYYGKVFLREYFEQRAMYVNDFEQRYLINLKEKNQPNILWLHGWRGILKQLGGLLSKDIQLNHDQILSLSAEDQSLPDLQAIVELNSAVSIRTESALKLLMKIAVKQDQISRDGYLFWLNRFLKRYEVSKKLYSDYQPSMKAASDDYSSQLNFALLSLTSLYEYEWTGNLKMLNTSLKLNDLLCSKSDEAEESETLLATILAIHKEKFFIEQVMTAGEVTI